MEKSRDFIDQSCNAELDSVGQWSQQHNHNIIERQLKAMEIVNQGDVPSDCMKGYHSVKKLNLKSGN